MENQPVIYVIVVTYKGRKWYDRCFSSLRKSTMPLQVIVVDNTPGDDDANYIRENFPEIHIIKTEKNLGFGKANNLGMRYALDHGCDYVFLLNQDAWMLDNDMFSKLVGVSVNHPEYGILSPMHVSADGETLSMMIELHGNECSMALATDLYKNKLKDVYPTDYVNAAAWFLPRKTLCTVGGFDPIYQHYEEDDDYLNRTRFHKLLIGICPSTRIVHDHHSSQIPFASDSDAYHHRQEILVRLTDLNNTHTIAKGLRYLLRKSLVFLITLKSKSLLKCVEDFIFIIKMCNRVIASRNQNVKEDVSWLY